MELKYELKRGFTIAIVVAILAGSLYQLAGIYYEYLPDMNSINQFSDESNEEYDYINAAATEYMNTYNGWLFGFKYYVFIIIFISCIPYSYKCIIDKTTGFFKYYAIRMPRRKIIINQAITNAIIGGLVSSLTIVVTLFVLMIKCTNEIPNKYMPGFGVGSLFQNYLFSEKIYIFITISICVMFFIGVSYATMAMAIGLLTNKIIASILVPQTYWLEVYYVKH